MPRAVSSKIYQVMSTSLFSSYLASSATVPVFKALSLSIGGAGPNTAYLAAFDQYRLDMAEVIFRPRVDVAVSAAFNSGNLATTIDFDDATTPTTFNSVCERPLAVMSRGDEVQKRTWRPRMAVAAYSGVFTSFANMADQWCDVASTGIQFYGLKMAWTATDAVYQYDATVRCLWSFRESL